MTAEQQEAVRQLEIALLGAAHACLTAFCLPTGLWLADVEEFGPVLEGEDSAAWMRRGVELHGRRCLRVRTQDLPPVQMPPAPPRGRRGKPGA